MIRRVRKGKLSEAVLKKSGGGGADDSVSTKTNGKDDIEFKLLPF